LGSRVGRLRGSRGRARTRCVVAAASVCSSSGSSYFTGNVPVGQLDHMVKFPEELGVLDEDNRMQRGLNKSRIGEMVRYLLEWPSHFYSAVTLIILPRDFDRPASEIDEESGEGDYAFERFSTGRPGQEPAGTPVPDG
jgi:DNA-sulfur modification-associated